MATSSDRGSSWIPGSAGTRARGLLRLLGYIRAQRSTVLWRLTPEHPAVASFREPASDAARDARSPLLGALAAPSGYRWLAPDLATLDLGAALAAYPEEVVAQLFDPRSDRGGDASRDPPARIGDLVADLAQRGFVRYTGQELRRRLGVASFQQCLDELRRAVQHLPPDPYAPGTGRFRRYSSAVAVPWDRTLRWLPTLPDDQLGEVSEYYQGDHNPDYPGTRRRFSSIPKSLRQNELLREIILDDLRQVVWHDHFDRHPLHVGVHLVKLMVDGEEEEAIASPNVLHQDGEPFTFAHLIARSNVSGGVNFIASPRSAGMLPDQLEPELALDCFELENPLDSYVVHDPLVSHYLSPIRRGPEPRAGERSVLLVDFTKLIPQI